MVYEDDNASPADHQELESREPSVEDLVNLCRHLNEEQANYIVVGGFAMRAVGYDRRTMDVDLLVAKDPENETRIYRALESLPDKAVLELKPGEIAQYSVVRVADEIVVDLMYAACGIEYREACEDVAFREIDGVKIPFASPRLLWKTKANTHREKDGADLAFLRRYLSERGEVIPEA